MGRLTGMRRLGQRTSNLRRRLELCISRDKKYGPKIRKSRLGASTHTLLVGTVS